MWNTSATTFAGEVVGDHDRIIESRVNDTELCGLKLTAGSAKISWLSIDEDLKEPATSNSKACQREFPR